MHLAHSKLSREIIRERLEFAQNQRLAHQAKKPANPKRFLILFSKIGMQTKVKPAH